MGQAQSQISNTSAAATEQQQQASNSAAAASSSAVPTPMHRSNSLASVSSDSSFEMTSINEDVAMSPQTQQQQASSQLQRPSSRSWAALAASASASPSRPDSRCSNASSFEIIDRSATPSLAAAAPHSALSSPLHMHALADSRAVSFGESVDSFATDGCSMPTTPLSRSSRASPRSTSPISMLCALESPVEAIAVPAADASPSLSEAEPCEAADLDDSLPAIYEDFDEYSDCSDDDLDDGLREDHRTEWQPNAQLRQRQQSAFGTRATNRSQLSRKQLKEEARVKLTCFRAVRLQLRNERSVASPIAPSAAPHPSVISLFSRSRASPVIASASVDPAAESDEEDAEQTESRAQRRAHLLNQQQRKSRHRFTEQALRVAKRIASKQQHLPADPAAKEVPFDPRSTSRRALNPLLLKDQPAAAIAAANRKASGPRWLVRHSPRQSLDQFVSALRPLVVPHVSKAFDDASAGFALRSDLALPPLSSYTPQFNAAAFRSFLQSRRASQQSLSSVELRVVPLSRWTNHEMTFAGRDYPSLRAHYKHAGAEWKAARKHLLSQAQGNHPTDRAVRETQIVCAVVRPEGALSHNPAVLPRRIEKVITASYRYRYRRQVTKRVDTNYMPRLRQTLEKLQLGLQIPLMALHYSAPITQQHMHRAEAVTKQQTRRVKHLSPPSKESIQRDRRAVARLRSLDSTESRDVASRGQTHSAFHRGLESAEINSDASYWCCRCCCDDDASLEEELRALEAREAQWAIDEAFEESRNRRRDFAEQVAAAARFRSCAMAADRAYPLADLEDSAYCTRDDESDEEDYASHLQLRQRNSSKLGGRVTIKSTITRKVKKQEKAHSEQQIAKTKAAAKAAVDKAKAAAVASSAAAPESADEELAWRQMKQQRREQLAAKFGPRAVASTRAAPTAAESTTEHGRTSEGLRTTAPNKRAHREAKRAILSIVRGSAEVDRDPTSRISSLGLLSDQCRLQRKDAARRARMEAEERVLPQEAANRALVEDDFTADEMTLGARTGPLKCESEAESKDSRHESPDSPELVAAHAQWSRDEIDLVCEQSADALALARAATCPSTDLEEADDGAEADDADAHSAEDAYDDAADDAAEEDAFLCECDYAASLAADFGFDSPAVNPRRVVPLSGSAILRPERHPASFDGPFQRVWAKHWMVKNMTVNKKAKGNYNHAVKPKTEKVMERLHARSQRSSSRAVEE